MLSFFGTELVRSHSQARLKARLKARLGMGPDSPGQLCPEEMTAWDSFFSPVTIKLLQELEQKRVLISFAFVLFEFIVCYDRRSACATNY